MILYDIVQLANFLPITGDHFSEFENSEMALCA